jgi:hypothetical protein
MPALPPRTDIVSPPSQVRDVTKLRHFGNCTNFLNLDQIAVRLSVLRACCMGKRSAIATTDAEVAKLTLPELNGQISALKWRSERPDVSASLRRSAFKRLVWLEERREVLHGIKAPDRKF